MPSPSLSDLMTRFLAAPASLADSAGDVVPHEVLTAFRVDARTAWVEAKEAVAFFGAGKADLATPAEWPALVVWAEAVAVPIAIGNYPQLARDVGKLIAFEPTLSAAANDADFPALNRWAAKESNAASPLARLFSAAVFRLLGRFDDAAATLDSAKSMSTGAWATVLANEISALAFARGEYAAAGAAWDALPDSPATAFNRGLARLALGRRDEARPHLAAAADGLPDASSWADLARLYLAVAETHRIVNVR
jgi:tetratricopeptide (TPR) repeat protein